MRPIQLWILIGLFATSLSAKDLAERYGFGVEAQSANSTPSLSLKYHLNEKTSLTGIFGFDTTDTVDALRIGAKLLRNASLEENINFYLGIGAFILSASVNGSSKSGFEFDGLAGAEFFLSGIPNLGFQFEAGVGVQSLDGVSFKTIGTSFAGAGIHYYF